MEYYVLYGIDLPKDDLVEFTNSGIALAPRLAYRRIKVNKRTKSQLFDLVDSPLFVVCSGRVLSVCGTLGCLKPAELRVLRWQGRLMR